MLRIIPHILYIRIYRVQLVPLLPHYMRNIPEKLVQLPHALLDLTDFSFPLHDQGFLEVDFVL